jgi:hypothetical protein
METGKKGEWGDLGMVSRERERERKREREREKERKREWGE